MAELLEHQREALAVARGRNVLVSGARPVGKTLMAAMRVREWLREPHDVRVMAVALAPTQDTRDALLQEVARLVSERVWVQQTLQTENDAVQSLAGYVGGNSASGVAIVSPKLFQMALRANALRTSHIGLLVLEHADEIHETTPSLYRQAFQSMGAPTQLRIFATTRSPVSKLDMDVNRNPLYQHIQVISISPIIAPSDANILSGEAPPRQPLLLSETFDQTMSPPEDFRLSCDVRDFLLGKNDKKIDFVGIYRLELELGNSAAVYDEKKKQDRVNRFIQDAQSVYQHLGLWCLFKFVELELQSNLHACLVDDVDNINQRRRRAKLEQQQRQMEGKNPMDAEEDAESDDESDKKDDGPLAEDTLAAFIENSKDLDDAKLTKVTPILKVLKWLASAATGVGIRAATSRLLKVAEIVKNRLLIEKTEGTARVSPRCWVFLERRAHCTVVAEYLTSTLADIGSPPCCSMLGHSNARIVGALHFSSYLKVITMFAKRETHVIVSTSLAKNSHRARKQPPLCDLVVVMDELLEADKLLDYCSRVCPREGAVKYLLAQSPSDVKKFNVLLHKFKELALLEQPASDTSASQPTQRSENIGSELTTGSSVTNPTPVLVPSVNIPVPLASQVKAPFVPALPVRAAPTPKYEVVHKDTGAVLNLNNSVEILSKFCDTLPGLDTYDRRPQYSIKRHQIGAAAMSVTMKQMKKKKQKFNSKLDDKIDDIASAAEARDTGDGQDVDMENTSIEMQPPRFLYTAKLQLPRMLRGKKVFDSPKVSSDVEAKAIVAFEGCRELVKGGLLDRSFRSTLEVDEAARAPTRSASGQSNDINTDNNEPDSSEERLKDLSTQNSYDLPPVSAAELGLPTVRSLLTGTDPGQVVSICFYGIEGIRFAILSTKELYTGNTNTGWRYDFATSDVMEPVVHKVTLQTKPLRLELTRSELQEALHFHLMTMRLACMHVDDAMREVDIKGDKVWNEFSEQNDKGYLVVPSCSTECQTGKIDLDWNYLREIISKPLLVDCWPMPAVSEWPAEEWVCVPTHRRNVCYVVRSITDKTAGEAVKPLAYDDEAWKNHYKTKSVTGVPNFGRWHTRDQVKEADPDQPLIHGVQVPPIVPLIRRVMQRNHDEASIAQSKTKFEERYFLPQYTSLLRLTKTRYFEAMGIVPLLYEFERKCQMSNLMTKINLELDLTLLDHATTKPLYERLEILGDTFLKLETSWFLFENRRDISEEGFLTQLRRDIIRNDRLNMFALAKQLHHYMLYPAEIEQHPFKFWKPSCMGKTPESIVAPSKWVADVLEAICGAYLVGQGEVGARHFLEWVGVKVPVAPHTFSNQYYPDCFPNEVTLNESTAVALARQKQLGFRVDRFDSVMTRLVAMQQRLKYTFNNKLLLLEAITHPSVGELRIISENTEETTMWKGNYERLEYLGDAVIEYLTLSYAFTNYQSWLPGSLSQWKSATVSNDALGKTAIVCFGVDECILSGALKIDRETLQLVQSFERRYTRDEALAMAAADAHHVVNQRQKRRVPSATAINAMALPKVYADIFEAVVAAVFLDSGHNLQTVRDVFLGPLLAIVGDDAYAYVCRESGLPLDSNGVGEDFDMEELRLLSEDEEY